MSRVWFDDLNPIQDGVGELFDAPDEWDVAAYIYVAEIIPSILGFSAIKDSGVSVTLTVKNSQGDPAVGVTVGAAETSVGTVNLDNASQVTDSDGKVTFVLTPIVLGSVEVEFTCEGLSVTVEGTSYDAPSSIRSTADRYANMYIVKKSDAVAARRTMTFEAVDLVDGYTPETGLTFDDSDIKIIRPDGTVDDFLGTVTEVGIGIYQYEFALEEIDTFGVGVLRVNKSGCRPLTYYYQVVGYSPYISSNLVYGLIGIGTE